MNWLDSRGVFLGMMALALVLPGLALLLIGLALAGQLLLAGLNLLAALTSSEPCPAEDPAEPPEPLRFSIHVAIHQEPPHLVARTLRSLAAQEQAPEFEVIVLDNNTTDPALRMPVRDLCDALGPRFRFFHEEGVKGAKAGALNIALERTDPRATHVIVVDADYEVAPDFLDIAAAEIGCRDVDFLQFPQAYRNDGARAAGISLELADYFLRHARGADGADAMLLTGTLSVLRRSALEAAAGWSGRTITEDAEMGLRLRRMGYRGRFVDRIVGRGLLPLDLGGLSQQRYRWAAGNVSTIRAGVSGLSPRAAIHVISQLTAWANLALPLSGGLIGGSLALALTPGTATSAQLLTALSGLGLALVYLSVGLPLILASLRNRRPDPTVVLAALSTRIALILPSATGTIDALTGRTGGFRRTGKDAASATGEVGPVLPALAITGLALFAVPGMPALGLLGAALLMLPFPLALATGARLSAYRASLQTE